VVDQHKHEIARLHAPLRKAEITLIDRPSDDLPLVELRIREGRRITTLELDRDTARQLAQALENWAADHHTGSE
jgi:hypothetical protein